MIRNLLVGKALILLCFTLAAPFCRASKRPSLQAARTLLKKNRCSKRINEGNAGLKDSLENSTACPICFEDYSQECLPLRFNCSSDEEHNSLHAHTFCMSCIEDIALSDQHKAEIPNCPLCRAQLRLFDPHKEKNEPVSLEEKKGNQRINPANIPREGKDFSYEDKAVVNSLETIRKLIPVSEHDYKVKIVIPETLPSLDKTSTEILCLCTQEVIMGALIGAFVSNELTAHTEKKNSSSLTLQRICSLPTFIGSTVLLNHLNPERKKNKLYLAVWCAGLAGTVIARYYTSKTSSQPADTK
ncbi:hypothetical protein H0W26_02480 [Candidatus Dependentiae bacterium]|nr:hypothetical protein [Candidatus Dependentiae bacterium]